MSKIQKRDEISKGGFAMSKITRQRKNSNVSLHWHNEFEIIFLLKGQTFVINDEDARGIPLREGDAILIPPACSHDIGNNPEDATALVLQFHIPEIIRTKHGGEKSASLLFRERYGMRVIRNEDLFSTQVSFLCKEIYRAQTEQESASEGLVSGAVQMLLFYFGQKNQLFPFVLQEKESLDLMKICAFIDEAGFSKVTADAVAKHMGYSKKYFSLKFKKTTGKSFKQFLDQLKMQEARRLLGERKTATEVAALLGYGCVQNLSRTFKRIYKSSITDVLNTHR